MGEWGSRGWNDTRRPLKGQTTPLDVVRVWNADGSIDGQAMSWTWTFGSGQNSSITQYGVGKTWAFTCPIATVHEPARLSTCINMFISSRSLAGSGASAAGGSVRSVTAVAASFTAGAVTMHAASASGSLTKPSAKSQLIASRPTRTKSA